MSHTTPADDQLIDLIYACLLGEASWEDFLAHLSNALPGGAATLFYHDATTGRGQWQLSQGLPQEAVGKYADYYSTINPWMPAASVRRVGIGIVAEQMYPRDKFIRTEFYNDYFRRFGESAVGITIIRQDSLSFLLSTLTVRADPEENMAAAEQLTRLAPHLRRVFNHLRQTSSEGAGQGGSLFDAIDLGLALVGEGGKLQSMSATAHQLAEATGCFRIGPTGRSKIMSDGANSALYAMLDRGYDGPRVANFIVNGLKLTLILTQKEPFLAYFTGPTVAVILEPPSRQAFDLGRLGQDYSLTAAEMRALSGVLSGQSTDEIASGAGRSRETIRSQMKSLYGKLGVSGRRDLVRKARSSALSGPQLEPASSSAIEDRQE